MSTKIASLTAEIGAKTDGVEAGLKRTRKEVDATADKWAAWSKEMTKQAKSVMAVEAQRERALKAQARSEEQVRKQQIRAAKEAANASKQSFEDFKSGALKVIAVVAAVGVALKGAFDDYMKYASAVRNVAQVSGTSAEEASRLLQVLDDFQITAEDVTAATKAMTKQGLSPTIDTLAKLSDEYLQINDAEERNAFVLKNLGKGGLEWVNVLNQGGEALRKMGTEVNKNLILTDAQIKKAEEQRLAVDAASDAWEGLKMQMGAAVGEGVMEIKSQHDLIQATKEYAKENNIVIANRGEAIRVQEIVAEKLEEEAVLTERAAEMKEFYTKQGQKQTESVEELTKKLEEESEANQALHSVMESFQGIADNYNDKMDDLKAEQADLLAQKQRLIEQGYSVEGEKIGDINQKLAENISKQQEAADAAEEATKRRIIAMVEAGMMADKQLSGQEFEALLALENRWGLMSDEAVTAAQDTNQAVQDYLQSGDIDAFTSAVDSAGKALVELPEEKTVKLNIIMNVNGQTMPPEQLYSMLAAMEPY